MKKIICVLTILGSITIVNAQAKKKQFVENYKINNQSASSTTSLQNKFYLGMKNLILSKEQDLGKDALNEMLIFNQEEFYRAIKQETETSKQVYEANMPAKLDFYKNTVMAKLDTYLNKK